MQYIKGKEEKIYTSKRGKVYRISQEGGKIIVKSDGKRVKPTKEILKIYSARLPKYTVYTDGGCAKNPGGVGGYGVVIIDENGETREYSGGFDSTTNNCMEIYAVLTALRKLGDCEMTLISDSEYVLKTVDGIYSSRKNLDLWEKIAKARIGKTIRTQWTRGHSGDRFNERCDELATQAMKKIDPSIGDADTGGAMSIDVDVSHSEYETERDPLVFAEKRQVNLLCAKEIIKFYKKGVKNFRAYANLKTFGKDHWSSLYIGDFEKLFEDVLDDVKIYHKTRFDIEKTLRWYARGLSLEDAIKKVYVDNEISRSVSKKRSEY